MKKKAVLVVDMLNDFTLEDAPLRVDENSMIADNIKSLIEERRGNDEAIIYICDSHREDDREFKIWPKHCVEGTKGAMIIDKLKPLDSDFIVKKTTYDGFYNTVLEDLLYSLNVNHLTITGCVSNICILHTASSAVLRGYEVEIPLNCISSLDETSKNCAIDHFKNVLNIKLI